MDVLKRLKGILIEATDGRFSAVELDQAGDDLTCLALDSLALIKIVVFIENEFNFSIDLDALDSIKKMHSLSSLHRYVIENARP